MLQLLGCGRLRLGEPRCRRRAAGQHALGDEAAAEATGNRPQARPGAVADQPVAGNAQVVGNGVLVRVAERLPHAAYGAPRPPGEPLVGPGCGDLTHDGLPAQVGIDSSGQGDEPLAELALALPVGLGRQALPGPSSQCVEIITARCPAGALSVSPAADTETNMLLPSPSGRA